MSKFHSDLNDLGFSTIRNHPGHYGLSLILGGAEITLWDLTGVYTRMAQTLANRPSTSIAYLPKNMEQTYPAQFMEINRAALYCAFDAMTEVQRPDGDDQWRRFSSSQKIAWKTGTSFGFRDAWSIGITPNYVVSVWIGNADGEGRPGLTGLNAAAPLLFELFRHLPRSDRWFPQPTTEMTRVSICDKSGHRATENCEKSSMEFIPQSCLETIGCPYHQKIHLNESGTHRVTTNCYDSWKIQHQPWFVLPSFIERFYQKKNPDFQPLPPYSKFCTSQEDDDAFSIVYPKKKQRIYLPKDFDRSRREIIFEATHRTPSSELFWHLDGQYIGRTKEVHQLALTLEEGNHRLSVLDGKGHCEDVNFLVLN